MNIRILDESVEIEGYVNAVERLSKPLHSALGEFKERIVQGAFGRAIERASDVSCLLNHDWNRNLGSIKNGNLELSEDNIGCRVRLTTADPQVREDALNGNLVGWSFGFSDLDVDVHDENGTTVRDVKDMELYEVSVLNRDTSPAYEGTLVTVRDDVNVEIEYRQHVGDVDIKKETTPKKVRIDYSAYEQIIKDLKGEK